MKIKFLWAIFTASVLSLAYARAETPYVVDDNDKKIEGEAIQADAKGTIKLKLEGNAIRTFSRGNYKRAYTPKPKKVASLETMLDQQKYDLILERGEEVFEEYKYLGWAGRVTYIRAEALLAKGRAEQALQLVNSGERYTKFKQVEVQKARVKALLELGELEKAEEALTELKKTDSDDIAAFAFNAAGKLLAEKGQKKDAVLEYLKTILVMAPETAASEKETARQAVADLLEELGDPRYKQFQQQ